MAASERNGRAASGIFDAGSDEKMPPLVAAAADGDPLRVAGGVDEDGLRSNGHLCSCAVCADTGTAPQRNLAILWPLVHFLAESFDGAELAGWFQFDGAGAGCLCGAADHAL